MLQQGRKCRPPLPNLPPSPHHRFTAFDQRSHTEFRSPTGTPVPPGRGLQEAQLMEPARAAINRRPDQSDTAFASNRPRNQGVPEPSPPPYRCFPWKPPWASTIKRIPWTLSARSGCNGCQPHGRRPQNALRRGQMGVHLATCLRACHQHGVVGAVQGHRTSRNTRSHRRNPKWRA